MVKFPPKYHTQEKDWTSEDMIMEIYAAQASKNKLVIFFSRSFI